MGTNSIPVLLVTANVGSIFENPSTMLKIWTTEFLSTVSKLDPKFIALHCQEVGGKNYEKSMKYVEDFVKLLMTSEELRLFDRVRVFIDEDYSSAENFTALGNIYFIHESIKEVLIWDFKDTTFVPVEGSEINTGNIETIVTKEKAKFPQNFFPECKWSRKGFLRTRWSLSGTIFDLINIHLFHDASNFMAMQDFPSVYCTNRKRALEHTLQRFHNDRNGPVPFFVFGDFNFRTDTDGVVKKLTEGLTSTEIPHHKTTDCSKIHYHNSDNKLVLSVGKKEFHHADHQQVFLPWLKSFDKELAAFDAQLFEFPLGFPPSYPFEESVSHPKSYMQTRCPAWCDRVLLSHTARELLTDEVTYSLMGQQVCMGDHKPVYLRLSLRQNAGTILCCTPDRQCCQNYASITIKITECDLFSSQSSFTQIDPLLLQNPFTKNSLLHDPYTPESAESHSPIPHHETSSFPKQIMSPEVLKSKLEVIIRSETKNNRLLSKSQSQQLNSNENREFFEVRSRCKSESHYNKKPSKLKLISLDSAQSILRLQSHHSSSDEDWYEVDGASQNDEVFEDLAQIEISKCVQKRETKACRCCCVS